MIIISIIYNILRVYHILNILYIEYNIWVNILQIIIC